MPTIEPLHADEDGGPRWLDTYSVQEAAVFRALGLAVAVEDTPGGRHFLDLGLDFPDDHPLASVTRQLWDRLSRRFVAAASGRVEVLVEGALPDSVFRTVELGALLANARVTCINGLDRRFFPDQPAEAFVVLRRWDVERSHRYSAWIDGRADADARESEAARDDAREAELWFAQDFFEVLGPQRQPPELPESLRAAVDRTCAAPGWKHAPGLAPWVIRGRQARAPVGIGRRALPNRWGGPRSRCASTIAAWFLPPAAREHPLARGVAFRSIPEVNRRARGQSAKALLAQRVRATEHNTRKPTLPSLPSVWLRARDAERQYVAWPSHDPPRTTRRERSPPASHALPSVGAPA